ncbi:hypothetical protein EV702DRAFT_1215445 [Suillus placidus]|uniref:Uncharacterized protein n=1 Tax=Suillus placidus TaxID=48579 RepID=A0A9P6ZGS2_9AGAM|nr:hypothetical protein EV702DRAFT_1206112 [Suillus placidus]KAG1764480.1 hypothetical protein EV702DRAFT_1215445 [Suillus placidus]
MSRHETDDTAIDAWVAHDDHYYVNECADSLDVRALEDLNPWSGNEFWHCLQCHEEHKANLARRALPDFALSTFLMRTRSSTTAEMDMGTIDPLSEPLSIADFMPSASQSLSELMDSSQSQTWSSIETPLNSATWSATAASPTSSHISSDYLLGHSLFDRRLNTIRKSAWGPQDWFSADPRLDTSAFSSSGSSFADRLSHAPSSPFSFYNLYHSVVDRYDLFPNSFPNDFTSDVNFQGVHTSLQLYAGDLVFGARTYQPQQSYYGPGFGFGTPGLGLSGMQQATGLHLLQVHTPALPGIDEIKPTSLSLSVH